MGDRFHVARHKQQQKKRAITLHHYIFNQNNIELRERHKSGDIYARYYYMSGITFIRNEWDVRNKERKLN